MSNRTEGIKLSLEVLGSEGVEELRGKLAAARAEGGELAAAFARGDIELDEYDAGAKRAASSVNNLEAAVRQLDAALAEDARRKAADEARDLADAEEMAALAAHHEAEMTRLEAAEARQLAEAADAAAAAEVRKADATVKAVAADQKAMLAADAAARATVKQTVAERDKEDAMLASVDAMVASHAASRNAAQDAVAQRAILDGRASAIRRVDAASRDGKKSASNLGLGFLEVSRAVEDAQYGFRGVINNIPSMVMLFGGTAGLASAISLASVALNTFLPKIKEFLEMFQGESLRAAVDQVKALEGRIKELSDKPMLLRVEQVELDEATKKLDGLKRGLAEYNRGQTQQSEAEATSGKGVNEALVESETGIGGIEEKLAKQAEARDLLTSVTIKEAQAAQARAKADADFARHLMETAIEPEEGIAAESMLVAAKKKLADAMKHEQDARNKIAEASRTEAGELVSTATKGNSRRAGNLNMNQAESQAELARRLRTVGESDVAADVAVHSPENTKKYTRAEADFKEGAGARKAEDDEKKKADDAASKEFKARLADELDILKGVGGIEKVAAELTAKAKEQGLTGDKVIESVKGQLAGAITGALGQRGFAIPDPQKGAAAGVIGDLAADAARAARKAAETGAGRDGAREGKDDAKDLDDEARRNESAIDKEVDKIKDTLGKQMQSHFELSMSRNNAAIANGAPVARTAAEDRRLTAAGVAHAVPPAALEHRLRDDMARQFMRRGAGLQSANLAAKGIGDEGKVDLQRRAADFGAQNLTIAQATLAITNQLQSQYEHLSGIQRQLVAEARRQGERGQSGQRNASKIR